MGSVPTGTYLGHCIAVTGVKISNMDQASRFGPIATLDIPATMLRARKMARVQWSRKTVHAIVVALLTTKSAATVSSTGRTVATTLASGKKER